MCKPSLLVLPQSVVAEEPRRAGLLTGVLHSVLSSGCHPMARSERLTAPQDGSSSDSSATAVRFAVVAAIVFYAREASATVGANLVLSVAAVFIQLAATWTVTDTHVSPRGLG